MELISAALVVIALGASTLFQSDDGWSGDRYAPSTSGDSRQFDQRGATIGGEPVRTAQASPWAFDATQPKATNTGNSLSDSVNSGFEQANQQLNQAGQQLRNLIGAGGQTAPPAMTSATGAARSTWPAPPPLAGSSSSPQAQAVAPGANLATTPAAWSSIQPQLAPPRLRVPSLSNSTRVASNSSLGSAATGPSFPPPTSMAPPLHSVLADPPASSQRAAEQDWASPWGSAGTATSAQSSSVRDADAGVGLEPVPPRVRASAPPIAAQHGTSSEADPWGWSDPPAASQPARAQANPAADAWANFGTPSNSAAQDAPVDRYAQPSLPLAQTVARAVDPALAPPPVNSQPAIGVAPPSSQPSQQLAGAAPGDEVPWKPLLAVSLALAASLGANFFLGVSYADARHRYLSLVAKTTHAFQKEAGIAA